MQHTVSDEFEHMVLLYKNSETLLHKIIEFVTNGFAKGEPAALVLRRSHRELLEQGLRLYGYDATVLRATKRLLLYDVDQTLKKLMVDDMPDTRVFARLFNNIFEDADPQTGNIRIYGEMVAVLWAGGNEKAALALEYLWNDFRTIRQFDLFCGYSHADLADTDYDSVVSDIGHSHTRVITPQTQLS